MGCRMTPDLADLTLEEHGAQHFRSVLDAEALDALRATLAGQPADHAGIRLFGLEGLRPFLAPGGPLGPIIAAGLSSAARPVRAILFDKTEKTNWGLAWHQDRVIAVRERRDVEGFGPWTRKHGALHVAPPFDLIAGMLTLRVHLDPVPETNAPLLIAPGSHRVGLARETKVPQIVARLGVIACLAQPGDVWAYSTPILHASERASRPDHRRVLQVDYATGDLPGGLEWLGV
jgi:hypothetical protein